ncbi:HET-domain-containing protein [Thozetella sp. PMI_491]|nr:HET-domain-containing protein [Thozetella sp. PMI_491]
MRLINTRTLELHEFYSGNVPAYAILSHTWEEDEVSFEDLRRTSGSVNLDKRRYAKLRALCHQSQQDDLEWAWIDTCCIDKTSSVELSEAINSTFNWYRDSTCCYVYLADVTAASGDSHGPEPITLAALGSSRWFTRGWTLQELIAPLNLFFYDQEWTAIGSKSSLCSQISLITGIDPDVLVHKRSLTSLSVATRMSWAAHRVTTRIEDRAYCLMGLFNIHMPMIYGEGVRSFQRLQEEIIKTTCDLTILAWHPSDISIDHNQASSSLLAPSPYNFSAAGSIEPIKNPMRLRKACSLELGLL